MPPKTQKVHFGPRGGNFTIQRNKFGQPVRRYIDQSRPGAFGKVCRAKCCFG
uniref:Uncharacterized protein n=1 Tax=viral metagenome TaxID=1070528 RepID=A0A6C0KCD8_9ZZZZ